jgi:hypothetical protein
MKNKIHIINMEIFFLMLVMIFSPVRRVQAIGCCIDGGVGTGQPINCMTPTVSATGQEICSSGTLFSNSCSNIIACNQANNTTTGNNSTTNTGTFPTNNTGTTNNTATNTTNANSATPTAFTIPTGFGFPDPQGGVTTIIKNLLDWLLGIIGAIAVIAFVISGAQYLMASGNERIIEVAKKNMFYSILGIIVALSGAVIITAIDAALRAWILF